MTNMVIATILTQREKEVLALIGDGNDAKTAALKLGISPKTIEAHKARISHKVRIKGIANLTKLAIRLGLTSNEERTE